MRSMNSKPNILFIFSDQQRWDTLGCYGQCLDVSPNLDRLASEGVKFENAFTCQPVCGPSRACLQTGKYQNEHGCFLNGIALGQNEKTMAHYLSEAGYETAYVGKWHLASDIRDVCKNKVDFSRSPVPQDRRGGYKDYWVASDVLEFTSHGYDGYMFNSDMEKVEFKGYRADCTTDFALDYLRNNSSEKPFFLFLSYIEPHHQNDHNSYEGPEGSKQRFKDCVIPEDLRAFENGDYLENYPDYLGCCSSIDYNVGRLVDELKKQGRFDNTVIIYTSDHGSHFRTRNSEYKRACHDSCIRIPMIIRGPGFDMGRDIDSLVSLMDMPSTVLSLAGVGKGDFMHGNPLQQLVSGQKADWPEEVFVQISESQIGRALRTKKWKYSVVAPAEINKLKHSDSKKYIEAFLYDLENDPHELNNLVDNSALDQVRKVLREKLIDIMAEANEVNFEITPCY